MALAAMGFETDFRKLKAEGLKPMLLAAAAWVFISVFALALVKLTAYSEGMTLEQLRSSSRSPNASTSPARPRRCG